MPTPLFKPGNPGGPGRPKGSKDIQWNKLPFWMQKIENEWKELTPKDRVYVALEAWKTLMKRVPLPADVPEESVENANSAFDLLKRLQEGEKVDDASRV